MLEGSFVTITGFNHYKDKEPFPIGTELICGKEPDNAYDSEAIKVFSKNGDQVGYIANGIHTKANGTMSAARVYDRVGNFFSIEVCFTTQTKIICKVINFDVPNPEMENKIPLIQDIYDEIENNRFNDEERGTPGAPYITMRL